MNTSIEHQLLDVLEELNETVRTRSTSGSKTSLLPLFSRIDELTGKLPPETDATLVHYLNKKSYEKARLYLQGRDAENQRGRCRHV